MLKVIVSLIAALLLAACAGDSPFLTKGAANRLIEDINTSRDPFHAVKNIVAIIDNDIYYFNRLDTIPRKITNSPTLSKTLVRLSSDKTKVAYLNENGHPVIIDANDGKVLEVLTEFNYITQMDWVKNSATLFMLIGRQVELHGTPLPFIQPESYHAWDDVPSFSMNSIGDQGYFISRYNDLSFGDKFKYQSMVKNLDEEYPGFQGEFYNHIDFYDDRGNFLLGYKNSDEVMQRIVCVQNYKFYTAYEWDYESMQTPQFNSEHEILLYGTVESQELHDEQHYIKGVYLGTDAYPATGLYDRLTKILTNYPSKTPIYLDWAQ